MSAPGIKICGITDEAALEAAIAHRAAHVGFVFFDPSPRNLSRDRARALANRAQGRIGKVGLFVDPDDALLADGIAAGSLGALQLHGEETPERASQVRARFGLPVWKALPVASADDIERAAAWDGAVDLVLFDARTPKGGLPGGMGLRFDWSLVSGYRGQLPWGLAGGLTPANVAEALRLTGAALLDTSSGVENSPGIKDPQKIAAFCRAARVP